MEAIVAALDRLEQERYEAVAGVDVDEGSRVLAWVSSTCCHSAGVSDVVHARGTLDVLAQYDRPGNVRELENV